jgi:hypothetical protein
MLVVTRTNGAAHSCALASNPTTHDSFLIIRSPYLTRSAIP